MGQNTNKIPFSKEAPVVQDDDQEIMTSHLLQGILPDMTKQLSMIEVSTEMQDLCLSFSVDIDVPAISVGPDCSTEGFHYLACYVAYRGRKHDPTMGTPSENVLPPTVGTSAGGWLVFISMRSCSFRRLAAQDFTM